MKSKLLFLLLLLIVGFAIYFFVIEGNSLDDAKSLVSKVLPNESTEQQEKIPLDENFIDGLRLASVEKYDEALSHFEKVKFKKLNEQDKYIVLKTYLEAGQPDKAIRLDNTFDKVVIDNYVKNETLEKLREIKTKSELVSFEVAVLDNHYEKIIELKDTDRLVIDKRKAMAIANAYYQLGLIEQAVDFTSLTVYDGINVWADYEASDNVQTNESSQKNSSTIEYLTSLLILGIIGLFVFLLYKIKNKLNSPFNIFKKNKNKNNNDDKNILDINVEDLENNDIPKNEEVSEVNKLVGEDRKKDKNGKYSYHYND